MKLTEIKRKMIAWRDFYGADIFETDRIREAKTKKDLDDVLHDYRRHMEDREQDALSNFDKFHTSLKLRIY